MPPTPTRPRSPMAAYRARKDKGAFPWFTDADGKRESKSPRSIRLSGSLAVEHMDVCSKQSLGLCTAPIVYCKILIDSRDGREFAIKKFKPDKEGETVAQYSGISQSAVREMAVLFPSS
jgi:hypothetical protein